MASFPRGSILRDLWNTQTDLNLKKGVGNINDCRKHEANRKQTVNGKGPEREAISPGNAWPTYKALAAAALAPACSAWARLFTATFTLARSFSHSPLNLHPTWNELLTWANGLFPLKILLLGFSDFRLFLLHVWPEAREKFIFGLVLGGAEEVDLPGGTRVKQTCRKELWGRA